MLETRRLRGKVTLVPVANASAYERSTRAGVDGLDLARSFPGTPVGSITERIAFELTALINDSDAYIDLHSGGRLLRVSPLVGYMLVEDASILQRQRKMAHAFCLPVIWGTTRFLDGRSLSTARDAGVPAIYAEYLGGGVCSDAGVEAYVSGCLNVMGTMGMLDRSVPACEPSLVVEDPRAGSGHMQVQHQAPVAGRVAFGVSLGDTVVKGQEIGYIVVPPGGRSARDRHRIAADRGGLVLCLHAAPDVEKGDCLAVILEKPPNHL